jgi:uncharacterized membrane protein YgcG
MRRLFFFVAPITHSHNSHDYFRTFVVPSTAPAAANGVGAAAAFAASDSQLGGKEVSHCVTNRCTHAQTRASSAVLRVPCQGMWLHKHSKQAFQQTTTNACEDATIRAAAVDASPRLVEKRHRGGGGGGGGRRKGGSGRGGGGGFGSGEC